jgi:hypothetical protein
LPALGAEGAPVDPVSARSAMNAIAIKDRPATTRDYWRSA